MAHQVEAYPLQWPHGWPRTHWRDQIDARNKWGRGGGNTGQKRRPWNFSEVRDELFEELERFGATSIVLSTNYKLTKHGLPSRNFGVPDDCGVAVYFMYKGKQMVMAQDRYTRAEENLRALSLVLRYLRNIDEMGGGHMMEKAFSGFEALPPPSSTLKRSWREVFGFREQAYVSRETVDHRYRVLSKTRHPDSPTGSHEAMSELNVAHQEALKGIGS